MIPLQFKKTHQIMRNSKSVHLPGRCRILSRAVGGTGTNGIYILLLTPVHCFSYDADSMFLFFVYKTFSYVTTNDYPSIIQIFL